MSETDQQPEPIRLGWEEWLGLPNLGLPTLRAKVDTGARTSALHAFDIEAFGSSRAPKVRFGVHPIPGRDDISITCSAPVVDRREVTSSNGEIEMRYVIETMVDVGDGQSWPIEVTLTDRATMASRMLLGRQALRDDVVVQPTERFLRPERKFDVYTTRKIKQVAPRRALRIAVLSREANNYSTKRLVHEGEERGHSVEIIDTTRCYMAINALAPEVHYDGKRLPRYDAVIPRIGASITPYGTAIVRQFETLGTYCLNSSAGISASRDKLHAHQVLAGQKVGMPTTAFAASPKDTSNLIGLVGSAPDRETSGKHAGQGRRAGRNQEGRRIRDRRVSGSQGELPRPAIRQGGRRRGHSLFRHCRQGRGVDEAHLGWRRFPLEPAPRRIGGGHPDFAGRAPRGGQGRQGLWAGRCRGGPLALRRRAESARSQQLSGPRRHREGQQEEPGRQAVRSYRGTGAPRPVASEKETGLIDDGRPAPPFTPPPHILYERSGINRETRNDRPEPTLGRRTADQALDHRSPALRPDRGSVPIRV